MPVLLQHPLQRLGIVTVDSHDRGSEPRRVDLLVALYDALPVVHGERRVALDDGDHNLLRSVLVVDLPHAIVGFDVPQGGTLQDDPLFLARCPGFDLDAEVLRLERHRDLLGADGSVDWKFHDDLLLGLLPRVPLRRAPALVRREILHPTLAVLPHVTPRLQPRHLDRRLALHLEHLLGALPEGLVVLRVVAAVHLLLPQHGLELLGEGHGLDLFRAA